MAEVMSEWQIAHYREIHVFRDNDLGYEVITGNHVQSVNVVGVIIYHGGSMKELVPWHRVKRFGYAALDNILKNGGLQ
jgi:hypothetical protein